MRTVYCVEVLATYEDFGTVPTAQRLTNRDNDFALAQARIAQVGAAVAPQSNEYMERFPEDGDPRYGTGWRCRQWIELSGDAVAIGNTIWNRLLTRNVKNGTKVEIFSRDADSPDFITSDAIFRRRIPTANDDVG